MPTRSHQKRNRFRKLSAEEEATRLTNAAEDAPWARVHPTLTAISDRLQLVLDAWNLLRAPDGACRRKPYLPQGIKEPDPVYASRIQHAQPTGFFRDALRTYAGMLSFLHWRALPASLKRVIGDVDGMGTDLAVFLFIADLLVLRDGGCLVLVLPPVTSHESEGHRLEAIARGDRASLPRLLLVPRADLLHWRLATDSRALLEFWIRRDERRPVRPLQYGATPVLMVGPDGQLLEAPRIEDWLYTRFLLTTEGFTVRTVAAERSTAHPSGYQARPAGKPQELQGHSRLPAVWYATDGAQFGEGDLPHLGLAHQYLTHFRLKTEYEDLLSRCALPVGVRTGVVDRYGTVPSEEGEARQPEQLVLSTNSFLDLPDGADFNWKEIRARSLAEHRAHLLHLEDTMRRDALVPTENRGPGRSESEVSLTAGQAFALLQSLAARKTSVFSLLLEHWCALTGEKHNPESGVSLTVSPLTPPPRPLPSIGEWLQLHERGIVTDAELRHQLDLAAMPGVVNPAGDGSSDTLHVPASQ
ncbi:DUF4055 domain-containing protein [Cyanobium sp. ATX 6A2]|uniref:DUF4055 domain-containing protein n=1 Tax=Cyanobium sp. ATX 6A2 TaxID=2823700 RepID=UPI0020CCE7C4|nr:DUF4055 domain-containing protein [Cyanobium sp. ATX 6A2]MCP9889051.1 DUF4055 domain-containing protein [Cyanobium sp. ATX 6A2]